RNRGRSGVVLRRDAGQRRRVPRLLPPPGRATRARARYGQVGKSSRCRARFRVFRAMARRDDRGAHREETPGLARAPRRADAAFQDQEEEEVTESKQLFPSRGGPSGPRGRSRATLWKTPWREVTS